MSKLARLFVLGLLVVAVYYAVFGGEYSVFEVRASRSALAGERITLLELETQLDSMAAWADSLRNDPVTLERVARERFGMIKEGETLYRFAVPGPEPSEDER